MENPFWNGFLKKLTLLRVADRDQVFGCAEHCIAAIANDQQAQLPEIYVQFLKVMGLGAGRFMRGSDFYYPDILGVKAGAQEIAAEQGITLPPDILVIFMHQGYLFAFVKCGVDDDTVYFYSEGMPDVEARWASFESFLETELARFHGRRIPS